MPRRPGMTRAVRPLMLPGQDTRSCAHRAKPTSHTHVQHNDNQWPTQESTQWIPDVPAHAPIACCGLVPAGHWQPTGRRPTRTRGRLCPTASRVSCASYSRSCQSCQPDDRESPANPEGGDLNLLSVPPRSAESPDLDGQRPEVDSASLLSDQAARGYPVGFASPAARLWRSAIVQTCIFMQRCPRDKRPHK